MSATRVVSLFGQADVEVGPERLGDLLAKELADRLPPARRITSPTRKPKVTG